MSAAGACGPSCSYVRDLAKLLPAEQMLETGLVDYSVGAMPMTGAWVIVHEKSLLSERSSPIISSATDRFSSSTPRFICRICRSRRRSAGGRYLDATVAPLAGPVCEVITIAKRNLKARARASSRRPPPRAWLAPAARSALELAAQPAASPRRRCAAHGGRVSNW